MGDTTLLVVGKTSIDRMRLVILCILTIVQRLSLMNHVHVPKALYLKTVLLIL